MAKSFRLDRDLERKLEEAARVEGVPVSSVIREAVARRCDEILGRTLKARLHDVIGAVNSEGGRAARTGDAFRRLLSSRSKR